MYDIKLKKSITTSVVLLLVGALLFQFASGIVAVVMRFGGDVEAISRVKLLLVISITSLATFVGSAWFFSLTSMKEGINGFSFGTKKDISKYFRLIFFMALLAMPISIYLGELYQAIPFPDFMSSLIEWSEKMEADNMALMKKMLYVTSFGSMLVNVVVIALIPAFGEELVFRGIIQRLVYNKSHKIHRSVWIAAIIFSVLHFELSGLLPRIFLGAMLGYIYFYTGSLWCSIWAHFINNATIAIFTYFGTIGVFNIDILESDFPLAQLSGYMMMAVVLFVPACRSFYAKRKVIDNKNQDLSLDENFNE
ncbi:CPBP family intramembrane metalloprotease [Halosquirtibacter laminarini]|uniref:CPBP family intramembrane metalloprotease n=1 Tax=Halosquirtibacter laminarini TaxID=3374600 RepID=A0AC61NP31_9BACT|nr:CPBP family intramembrane metalloprotease [Prolixibacteraceae bacterium]